jgi:mono/diheme cytochrome c family protein
MLRWFILIYLVGCVLFFGLMGARSHDRRFADRPLEVFQDMDHQYKVRYQQPSNFFADGQASRKPVAGTIPMGHEVLRSKEQADRALEPGSYFATGLIGDYFGQGFPEQVRIDGELLRRGEERYGIYCSVCHGLSGDGKGVVGAYWLGGMLPPTANLVDARVSALPEGKIFHTITHGQGLMGPYGGNIPVEDRWAIVAFVRALQKSQAADAKDPKVKAAFEKALPKPAEQSGQAQSGEGA